MGARRDLEAGAGLALELWRYLRARRKWWLLPILILLLVAGMLALLGAATPLGPFIYPLF